MSGRVAFAKLSVSIEGPLQYKPCGISDDREQYSAANDSQHEAAPELPATGFVEEQATPQSEQSIDERIRRIFALEPENSNRNNFETFHAPRSTTVFLRATNCH